MPSVASDRVVLITGANEGIGYHMLTTLVANGYRCAGLDVNGGNLKSRQEAEPERVRYYECDVTDADSVQDAVSGVIDAWGRIDILVNNAGIANFAPFTELPTEETRREFEVNYFGCQRTIRAVLPQMRSQGSGIIHTMSSGVALGGHPGMTGYASTKGAIEGLARSLRLELRDENIVCTLMQPPMSDTKMTTNLGWPDWILNDPAEVGRKLAEKIESTDPVIYADWQTKLGLYLIQRLPFLWRKAIERFVDVHE